jgi:hypothetical protein
MTNNRNIFLSWFDIFYRHLTSQKITDLGTPWLVKPSLSNITQKLKIKMKSKITDLESTWLVKPRLSEINQKSKIKIKSKINDLKIH